MMACPWMMGDSLFGSTVSVAMGVAALGCQQLHRR
jgi:hypothetical protein